MRLGKLGGHERPSPSDRELDIDGCRVVGLNEEKVSMLKFFTARANQRQATLTSIKRIILEALSHQVQYIELLGLTLVRLVLWD